MHFTVISPDIYTYGAMLVAGILRANGFGVSLQKELKAGSKDTVFLSLYSTLHLLNPDIRSFVNRHRKGGGTCYVGGPVSAYPDIVLGELDASAVVLGEGEETVVSLARTGITDQTTGVAFRSGNTILVRPAPLPKTIEHPLPFIPKDIGMQMYDVGIDVPPDVFVEKVRETGAPILGISGLLTPSFESMKQTIQALESAGLRGKVKVIIGGGIVTEVVRKYVGADAFTDDAPEGVEICKKFVTG